MMWLMFFALASGTFSLSAKRDANLSEGTSAITYKLNGGRFGDNLSSYCRAKWLSFEYDIPLLYEPFPYSDQLQLHEREIKITKKIGRRFSKKVTIPRYKQYTIEKDAGILYELVWASPVPVNWHDQQFLYELKQSIAPRFSGDEIVMPNDGISVAVHIRTPGWFPADHEADVRRHPLKYVFIDYYIEQIKRLAGLFPDKQLYVHLFTDHEKPLSIIKQLRAAISNECIEYSYRKKGNNWHSNVVEDFFAMINCDCLIRTKSMFSLYAERLGNYQVVIYPERTVRKGKVHQVTKVTIKTSVGNKWKTNTVDAKYNEIVVQQTKPFVLITTLYNETHPERKQEYITCIEHNCAHPLIKTMHVLYDTAKDDDTNALLNYLQSKKIKITFINRRPTYAQCFDCANTQYSNCKVILCNGDIYFNDTLQQLVDYDLAGKFLALTRWEEWSDGSITPYYRGRNGPQKSGRETRDSQDAWIFQTPLQFIENANFKMGIPLCDCRIAYHAQKSGLYVFNPCKTIQSIHVHRSGKRNYNMQRELWKMRNEPYTTLRWCYLN